MEGGAASGDEAQDRFGSAPMEKRSVPPAAISSCVIQHRSSGLPLRVAPVTKRLAGERPAACTTND
jgi:hypothetical protein